MLYDQQRALAPLAQQSSSQEGQVCQTLERALFDGRQLVVAQAPVYNQRGTDVKERYLLTDQLLVPAVLPAVSPDTCC